MNIRRSKPVLKKWLLCPKVEEAKCVFRVGFAVLGNKEGEIDTVICDGRLP